MLGRRGCILADSGTDMAYRTVTLPQDDASAGSPVTQGYSDPMEEREISNELWQRIQRSINRADSENSQQRQDALDFYRGAPYGDEQDGYSRAMTFEVFEVIEWALPTLMRIMLHSGSVVEFNATSADDEAAAEQETDIVNHIILHGNDSWATLESWFKDALMFPNGYIKVWHEEVPSKATTQYEGLTTAQVGMLEDENTEITEFEEIGEDPQLGPLFNVTAVTTTKHTQINMAPVPPEEVLVDPDARTVTLDGCETVIHHREISRSDLIAMGYDKDLIESLPRSNNLRWTSERENRRETEDEYPGYGEKRGALEQVDYYECYVNLDVDGDGIAEYRRIVMVGQHGGLQPLLENEEWDYQPICAISCYPQAHRHIGMSMARVTMQLQRINSTLTRQLLDNLYRTNRPRQFAGRGVNLEQLMNYVPFGVVEVQDPRMVSQEQITPIVQHILPVIKHFHEEKEARTGVSRHAMGIDAETLAQSTMGAYMTALGQASARLEMLARNFAEVGMKALAYKVHHLLRKRQDAPFTMKMRGNWVDINPSEWQQRKDLSVGVGLGTGTPQERIASSMALLDIQKEMLQAGLATKRNLYKTLGDLTSAMGKSDAGLYFLDPNSPEAKQLEKQQQDAAKNEEQLTLLAMNQAADDVTAGHIIDEKKVQATIGRDDAKHTEKMTELELVHDSDVPGSAV